MLTASRACGKSSLTIRLTDDRFSEIHDVTIAAEIGSKVLQVECDKCKSPTAPADPDPFEKDVMKLQIWDTAGQEHYRAVTRSYFRNAAGCLLVYDVTRRSTFLHVKDWLDDIKDQAAADISICLVGNKLDLVGERGQRQVTEEEAREWAAANGILCFVETSAKTGDKVIDAYQYVANDIYHKIVQGKCNLKDRKSGVKAAGKKTGGYDMINLSEAGKKQDGQGGCC